MAGSAFLVAGVPTYGRPAVDPKAAAMEQVRRAPMARKTREDHLSDNIEMLGGLVSETRRSVVNPGDLNTVRNRARQEAAARGLDGPLAALMASEAETRVMSDFDRIRTDRLSGLINQHNMAMELEEQRRVAEWERRNRARQAAADRQAGIFSGVGSVLGGGLGFMVGGPMGAAAGATLGAGGGRLASTVF